MGAAAANRQAPASVRGGAAPPETMTRTTRSILLALLAAALAAAPAAAMGDPATAALQVALRSRGVYHGPVDGVRGAATTSALIRFQARAGLPADGIPGPQTRRALGKRGRPPYGSRTLAFGAVGWDVAALQFLLAWHGFPSGPFDGRFGSHLLAAVQRFQAWAGLPADGLAGRLTLRALRRPLPRVPLALSWPVAPVLSSAFGPRGARFHPGLDLAAAQGTPVLAARQGRVVFAGWAGGYGRLVVLAHGHGTETYYAHLSRIDAWAGRRVRRGARIGLVGSSGESTGPHLHFEVRVRGAAADPLPAL